MEKKPSSKVPFSLRMVEFPSMKTLLGASTVAAETVERVSRVRTARKAEAVRDISLHCLLRLLHLVELQEAFMGRY